MKWIPLSERKPERLNYYYYTDGKDICNIWSGNPKDDKFTHWLEFEFPPLPNNDYLPKSTDSLQKPKDPDWEKFEEDFNRTGSFYVPIFAIYQFLKAKYGD